MHAVEMSVPTTAKVQMVVMCRKKSVWRRHERVRFRQE